MDFRLSYEWLKEFVDVRLSPEELAERLSLHSVSVERIRRMDEGLDPKVVVGRVERIETHPNTDKLRIAYVVVRPSVSEISNLKSHIRVVCGGTNLREGMLVAYAPAGTRVQWHGEGDVVVLQPTEIRGVRSEGMICAASEIGLREYFAEGAYEILDCSFLAQRDVGKPLSAALGLDDVILDCEITTNRPDLMCVEELAREVAAITSSKLRGPKEATRARSASGVPSIRVRIDDRKGCPRYGTVVVDGVRVASSPWWVQRRLLAVGLRPINNVVDATNYVMLELGQPLHAFDAAKLQDGGILVRRARTGEFIAALDGERRTLTPDVLVIADAERPIAIAGVIGGQESGVTDATTRVVLECANFNPMVIRRGARALGIRTDASVRFEKGLQSEAIDAVLPRAVEFLCALAGGVAGKSAITGHRARPMRPIAFRPTDTAARIGVPITPAVMRRTFTALGCRIAGTGPTWRVTPPWWRRGDLEQSHDLVEEVARVHGYHALPSVLPTGTLPAAVRLPEPPVTAFGWEDRTRALLAGMGSTEFLTSSLIAWSAIDATGYTREQCVAIENPLSEELAYLRPAMLPAVLPAIAANQEHTPRGIVFELGNVYIPNFKSSRKRDAGLPREETRLLVASYGRLVSGDHVMQLKGIVERLLDRLGVRNAEFRRSESCVLPSGVCVWHPGRTMDVVVGETLVGVLGEVHPAVVEQFRIDARVAAAELDFAPMLAVCGVHPFIAAPSVFPAVKRDLAFTVDRKTAYAGITAVLEALDPLLTGFALFDTFEGGGVPMGKKSLAFHLTFSASDRTLATVEVDAIQARLAKVLGERFGAEVRAP